MSIQIRKIIRPAEAEGALPPHAHGVADITDFPEAMPPSEHTHATAEITNFPETMPPEAHAASHESGDDKLTNLAAGLRVGGNTVWHEGNLDPSGLGVDRAFLEAAVKVVVASDTPRYEAPTERSGISLVRVKEFDIVVSGAIRLIAEMKSTSASYNARANVYVNGEFRGQMKTKSTDYVELSMDLVIANVDKSNVYIDLSSASSSYTAYIRKVRLCYDPDSTGVVQD